MKSPTSQQLHFDNAAFKLRWSVRLFIFGMTIPWILRIPMRAPLKLSEEDCWVFAVVSCAVCLLTSLILWLSVDFRSGPERDEVR